MSVQVRDRANPYVEVETNTAYYLVSRAAANKITGNNQQDPLEDGAVDAYLNGLPVGRNDPSSGGSAYVYSKKVK